HGKPQSIAAVTKQRLLDAMHRSTAATKVAVNPLPNVKIFTHGKKCRCRWQDAVSISGS
ncbi:4-alpha-glucanotransferase, partial [Klebsiella pneumoniae]